MICINLSLVRLGSMRMIQPYITIVVVVVKNMADVVCTVSLQWFVENKLVLNEAKSQAITFSQM